MAVGMVVIIIAAIFYL